MFWRDSPLWTLGSGVSSKMSSRLVTAFRTASGQAETTNFPSRPSRPWSFFQGDRVTSSRINNGFFKMGALFIVLAFAITACLPTVSAQELSGTKGGLAGNVTDSSGAVVPDATVTVA